MLPLDKGKAIARLLMMSESIWNDVRRDTYRYARRTAPIEVCFIHTTRGGSASNITEYEGTKNWFRSPANHYTESNGAQWAGMASRIVGGNGKRCIVVPDEYVPTFSAGVHDGRAISWELAQATINTPIDADDYDTLVRDVAAVCSERRIPPRFIPFLDANNSQRPGIAFHDGSANGRTWGKTDPGPLFDKARFCTDVGRLLGGHEEDDMAITLVACGDSPTGYRLYALGQGAPVWVTQLQAAQDLERVFGAPKPMQWRTLVALGAQ